MLLSWVLCAALFAGEKEDAVQLADKVVALMGEESPKFDDLFHPELLKQVPPERLKEIFKSLRDQFGKITKSSYQSGSLESGAKLTLFFEKGVQMTLTLAGSSDTPPQVKGLFFGPPRPTLQSPEEVLAAVKELGGKTSLCVWKVNGNKFEPLLEHQTSAPLAIGSTFKLFLLATLMEKEPDWSKVVKIDEKYKSYPSGVLQTWPAGSPVTLHTLATEMISISDNTAADHVLFYLGRETVESALGKFGVESASQNVPFLSTLEVFKLKSLEPLREKFLEADAAGRKQLLEDEVAKTPRQGLPIPLLPTAIDTVEWFASTADLCRTMTYIYQKDHKPALEVMSINPGLNFSNEKYEYVGFKGGNEPGAISLSWLLKNKNGDVHVIAATWNNPEGVDNIRFQGLMEVAIEVLTK